MSRVTHQDGVGGPADERAVIEANHFGLAFWPAIDPRTGSVQLRRMTSDGVPSIVWCHVAGKGDAQDIFDWMTTRPDHWYYWGRLVILFGDQGVEGVVVQEALRNAEVCAAEAEQERLDQEDRDRRHMHIDLFTLDDRNKRPGFSLESGDEDEPFFVMRFSERWERERVLDWLRWQKHRFIEFRYLHTEAGQVALERAIIAGMRNTETKVKTAGDAMGGRRPLRFWRGE